MAVRGRPPKNGIKTKRERPDLNTKEELINYLNVNSDDELPFVEEVWDQAVIKAKENEGKTQSYRIVTLVDDDGSKIEKKQALPAPLTNPVKCYFRAMGLKQNKDKAIKIKESRQETDKNKIAISDAKFGDNEQSDNTYVDEISSWITLFRSDERDYLKRRYVNYYDTYEINEGADKLSLKRLLSLEIELYRIDKNRALGKPVNMVEEEKLTKQLNMMLESLKWTKKQRSVQDDMAQNKFTVWMDKMVQEGEFKPNPKHYDKDEVDFIIDTCIESQKEMLS